VIISENCKLWILKFVENRIQQDHGKTLIEFINSSPDLSNDKIVKEFLKRQTTSLSSEIDISPLCVVIKTGNLLKPGVLGELKSIGRQNNTTGDQIDRILEILNTFKDTAEANLDESDYDDHINDFKDIGKQFERINGEKNGIYTKQIEEIHNTFFDASKVERIVIRYKQYVEIVRKIEMISPVEERPDSVAERPDSVAESVFSMERRSPSLYSVEMDSPNQIFRRSLSSLFSVEMDSPNPIFRRSSPDSECGCSCHH